jgi:hypothetical protein
MAERRGPKKVEKVEKTEQAEKADLYERFKRMDSDFELREHFHRKACSQILEYMADHILSLDRRMVSEETFDALEDCLCAVRETFLRCTRCGSSDHVRQRCPSGRAAHRAGSVEEAVKEFLVVGIQKAIRKKAAMTGVGKSAMSHLTHLILVTDDEEPEALKALQDWCDRNADGQVVEVRRGGRSCVEHETDSIMGGNGKVLRSHARTTETVGAAATEGAAANVDVDVELGFGARTVRLPHP